MNTFNSMELYKLIQSSLNDNPNYNFFNLSENLRSLSKCIQIKKNEIDNLALIYYDETIKDYTDNNPIINNLKSLMMNTEILKPVYTQYNRIIYNDNGIKYLKDNNVDFNNVVIQECYEGTLLVVYYYNDHWNIATRRCSDAHKSLWIKNVSYGDLFDDVINTKYGLDNFYSKLNKDYCYHFVLVHHLNKNIVDYSKKLGNYYKELYHILTTEMYTLNEINVVDNFFESTKDLVIDNLDNLLKELDEKNKKDITNKNISSEGFVLRIYEGEKYKSPFTVIKLQTDIYQQIAKIKPNNNNIYQCFLQLYISGHLR